MSNEREELAEIIKREYTRAIHRKRSEDCWDAPADAIAAAGYRKLAPGSISTEWGVQSPWGTDASLDYETARVTVKNMKDAGHKASIVWRGVTQWQER